MKTYISNVYGMIVNPKIARIQQRVAMVGKKLGYFELGIYNYPAQNEPENELVKRIEGILAVVKNNDIVVLQLPTGNGERFDMQLVQTINARRTKVVMLWHSIKYYLKQRDKLAIWSDYEILPSVLNEATWYNEDFFIQKILVEVSNNALHRCDKDVDEIHVGLGVHDKDGNYCSWLGVTMQSIIEHTDARVCFHILHDDTLTEKNKRRLSYVAYRGGQRVEFHLIDKSYFESQDKQMGIYTIGALFRILLPEVCSDLSRVIYLDSDLLVNCDIDELWNVDISEYCLAAVPDNDIVAGKIWAAPVAKGQMSKERYFNSGVIYMNLDKIRQSENMREAVLRYIVENPDTNLPDQDALNVIYQNETLLLDNKWNRFARHTFRKKEKCLEGCIYHYVGFICTLYNETAADLLYLQTTCRTPWGENLQTFYINRSIDRQLNRIDNLRKLVSKISAEEKKYIFYGTEKISVKKMYNLLSVTPQNAYRILNDSDGDGGGILECKNLQSINDEEKGSFIVFVLPEADGGKAVSNLDALKLENQKDFWVLPCLVTVEEGGYLL